MSARKQIFELTSWLYAEVLEEERDILLHVLHLLLHAPELVLQFAELIFVDHICSNVYAAYSLGDGLQRGGHRRPRLQVDQFDLLLGSEHSAESAEGRGGKEFGGSFHDRLNDLSRDRSCRWGSWSWQPHESRCGS